MPKPAQKPHPPIWIGASTEGGFCRAAKWADALCSSPRHHLSDLKNHYASYRRYLKEFGRQEACTPVIREVYCAESMKQAEEEGGPGMIYIQAGMYGRWAQARTKGRPRTGRIWRRRGQPGNFSRTLHPGRPRALHPRDRKVPT